MVAILTFGLVGCGADNSDSNLDSGNDESNVETDSGDDASEDNASGVSKDIVDKYHLSYKEETERLGENFMTSDDFFYIPYWDPLSAWGYVSDKVDSACNNVYMYTMTPGLGLEIPFEERVEDTVYLFPEKYGDYCANTLDGVESAVYTVDSSEEYTSANGHELKKDVGSVEIAYAGFLDKDRVCNFTRMFIEGKDKTLCILLIDVSTEQNQADVLDELITAMGESFNLFE